MFYYFADKFGISTHTLTWSVTAAKSVIKMNQKDFNSHAHVERDFFFCRVFLSFCHFNSHAHVERDLEYSDSRGQTGNFNSHAHVERDEK